MLLNDLLTFVKEHKYGVTKEEVKNKFKDNSSYERLFESALDMGMIIKNGKGKATRYYEQNAKIIIPAKNIEQEKHTKHGKERVQQLLDSNEPLDNLIEILYEEPFLVQLTGRELFDFARGGYLFHSVKMKYSKVHSKNGIYAHNKEKKPNKISIESDGNKFFVKLYSPKFPTQPEVKEFASFGELNEYIEKNW